MKKFEDYLSLILRTKLGIASPEIERETIDKLMEEVFFFFTADAPSRAAWLEKVEKMGPIDQLQLAEMVVSDPKKYAEAIKELLGLS